MFRSTSTLALLALASGALLASLPAHAYIGKIGSPVVPSNPPPKSNTPNSAGTTSQPQATQASSPLLVITFNQQHVYFDRVLRQAIESSEHTKSGVVYTVVSVIPTGTGSNQHTQLANSSAAGNLDAVVQEMQTLGVQSSRINVKTQPSANAQDQAIDIFVN